MSCYLVPGARNRYLAPILPLIALLIGLAAQQCCEAAASEWLVRLRRHFFLGMGLVIAGLDAWIVVATALRLGTFRGQQPVGFCHRIHTGSPGRDGDRLLGRGPTGTAAATVGALTVAAFLGLTYIGVIINIFVATWHPHRCGGRCDCSPLPENVELVSIGPVDDVFLYNYGRPISSLRRARGSATGTRLDLLLHGLRSPHAGLRDTL